MRHTLFTLRVALGLILCAALGWADAAPFAYIAERGASNVRVIDTASNQTVANIPVDLQPFGVAVNTAGSQAYVTNLFSDSVSVIDTATHAVVASVAVGVAPFGIAVNPAGTRVYVANGGDDMEVGNTVSVIDTSTNSVVATVTVENVPIGVAVSPDGARLYVSNGLNDSISVIDTATNTVVTTISVDVGPAGLAIDPLGRRLYVTHPGVQTIGSSVSVIDLATNAVVGNVAVQTAPFGIAMHPDGSRLYVANTGTEREPGNAVAVIDTSTLEVTATVTVGSGPQGVSVHPQGHHIYVTNGFSNTISVIDAATNLVTATLPVGSGPVSFGNFVGPGTAANNYQGLWWRPSESGWGVNITQQGGILFATWFTYDTDGSGMWLSMEGRATGPGTYGGTLYRTTGPAFSANPWDPTQVTRTPVGTGTFTFSGASNGTFSYVLNGISQSKPITRLIFGSSAPVCAEGASHGGVVNYQDLWWRSPANSESGWGVNITHQGDILFATWFTYDASGRALWLASEAARTGPGVYSGSLYRTTGPAFNAIPFDPALVTRITVGSAAFSFSDASNGTFAYTVDGISQTKPITRLIYSNPATVCR